MVLVTNCCHGKSKKLYQEDLGFLQVLLVGNMIFMIQVFISAIILYHRNHCPSVTV